MGTKKFIAILVAALLAYGNSPAQNTPDESSDTTNESSELDLSSAFKSLKKTMGAQESSANTDDALDAVLEDAFDPIPEPVRESEVKLSDVDSSETPKAIEKIGSIPVNDGINVDYRQTGTALSLLLWNSSSQAMQNLLTNLLKQLYSDNDAKNFRFIVDSSPIPSISAKAIDLNAEARERIAYEYKIAFDRAKHLKITAPIKS